jgi:hypothetical protein
VNCLQKHHNAQDLAGSSPSPDCFASSLRWCAVKSFVPRLGTKDCFACQFQEKRFNYQRTITGLSNPSADLNEIRLLHNVHKHHKRFSFYNKELRKRQCFICYPTKTAPTAILQPKE